MQHRLADDIAATDDDRLLTVHGNIRQFQHADAAGRRAGHKPRLPGHQPTDIDRMEPIDILGRIDAVEDLGFTVSNLLRQWQLHQDAVDPLIEIEFIDLGDELALGRLLRQLDDLRIDAKLLAGFMLVAHIHLRSRITANDDDRQPRRHTMFFTQDCRPTAGILLELLGKYFSFQNSC